MSEGRPMTRRRWAQALAVSCATAALGAGVSVAGDDPAVLVRKFEPKAAVKNSNPAPFGATSSRLFFRTTEGDYVATTGLWRVHGADGVPSVVRDLRPEDLSWMSSGTPVGESLFFGTPGKLWRVDGDGPATAITNFQPSAYGHVPQPLGNARETLLFSMSDASAGTELWSTDGTPAGTRRLVDIAPGLASSYPGRGVTLGSVMLFPANDGVHGRELWRTDGTAPGTGLAVDLRTGTAGSDPVLLGTLPGKLLVRGAAGDGVATLWATDGSAAGTQVLYRTSSAGAPGASGMVLGDVFLFLTAVQGGGSTLWRTDGTGGGTIPLASWTTNYTTLVGVAGGAGYVGAVDAAHGMELWRTDGTPAGTALLSDIEPGAPSSGPSDGVAVGGVLVFQATTSANGREMWRTDGTPGGTYLLADVTPGPAHSIPTAYSPNQYYYGMTAAVGGAAWFAAGGPSGTELWATDGTAAGTHLAGDLAPDIDSPSITEIESSGGTLFLSAPDPPTGRPLWKSDGTGTGTSIVAGSGPSSVAGLTDVGGRLLYIATTASGSIEIRESDGISTAPVATVADGTVHAWADGMSRVGNLAYFRVSEPDSYHYVAWRTDGTAPGTIRLGVPNPSRTTEFLGEAFWFSRRGGNWDDLWRSDGTVAGTVLVRDLTPPLGMSAVSGPVVFDGKLFFSAVGSADGWELWRSDGTTQGTVVDTDLVPGPDRWIPLDLTVAGGTLFFSAAEQPNARELFARAADGTVTRLWDLRPAADRLGPTELAAVGTSLFFAAPTAAGDSELWTSDGTRAGTRLVREIECGPAGSFPRDFLDVGGGRAVFVATDSAHGTELWTTDGTADGTALVADIASGPASSDPAHLTLHGGDVFFAASADGMSTELWRIPVASLAALAPPAACEDLAPVPVPPPSGPEPAPLDAQDEPPPPGRPLDLVALDIRLPRDGDRRDSLALAGRLPVEKGFEPLGVPVHLDVGGATFDLVLDRHGRASAGGLSLSVRREPRRRGGSREPAVRFRLDVLHHDLRTALADEQLTLPFGDDRAERTVTVTVLWQGATFARTADVVYTERHRIGRARMRSPR